MLMSNGVKTLAGMDDCYFFLKGKSPAQVKLHYMYACLEYVSGK